jgi:hypothetical protein
MEIKIISTEKNLYKSSFSFYNLAHFTTSLLLVSFLLFKYKYNTDLIIIIVIYIFNLFFIKKACEEKNRYAISYVLFGIFFPVICSIILLLTPSKRFEIRVFDIESIDDLLLSLKKFRKTLELKNQIYNAALISKVIIDHFESTKEDEDIYEDFKNKLGKTPEYTITKTK